MWKVDGERKAGGLARIRPLGLAAMTTVPTLLSGPIVVPLFVSPAPQTNARDIKQSGVATPNAGTTGAALCQNPSAYYYVNYHTTAFPNGAIRGQLR